KTYTIEMDYYEHAGGASAQLLWSSASLPKGVVPTAQLLSSTGLPGGGDLDGDGIPDFQDPGRHGVRRRGRGRMRPEGTRAAAAPGTRRAPAAAARGSVTPAPRISYIVCRTRIR